MQKESKYEIGQVIEDLRKKGVNVNRGRKTITIHRGVTLGIKSLGKMDYLIYTCKYQRQNLKGGYT